MTHVLQGVINEHTFCYGKCFLLALATCCGWDNIWLDSS